jgi:hypothetical protein
VVKVNQKALIELFEIHEIDKAHVSKLGGSSTIRDKLYRHICYMFETFYACSIEPEKNITQNPGCEWQLCLYRGGGAN